MPSYKISEDQSLLLADPDSAEYRQALKLATEISRVLAETLNTYNLLLDLKDNDRVSLREGETPLQYATYRLEFDAAGQYVIGLLMSLGLIPTVDTEDDRLLFAIDTLKAIIKDHKEISHARGRDKSYATVCEHMAQRAKDCLKYRTYRLFRKANGLEEADANARLARLQDDEADEK